MRPPGPALQLGIVAVLCLVWGSTWLVIQEGLDDMQPLTSLALRFTLSGLLFVPLTPWLARIEGGTPPTWRLRLVMGVVIDAVSYAIIYQVEQTLPSGLTSVLWAVYPLILALMGHFLLAEERLTPLSTAGFLVGFLGVALLFREDLADISPAAVHMGAVLLLSPLVSAAGTVVIKREGAGVCSALLVRDGLLIATALLWPLAFLVEDPLATRLTPRAVFSFVYLAVLGTVVCFSLYFWLLRHAAATRLALIAYVTPAVALLLGWLVRDEAVGPTTLAGAALVVGGVFLVGRRERASDPEPVTTSPRPSPRR